ncbi:MAG TPA: hotdog domain-containing protein [Mycobacteriales bacterium]|nr:hotdog domain-containing protein [Mycobacteriales bacterium]
MTTTSGSAWESSPASNDPRFNELIAALRRAQDAIAAAAAPNDVLDAATERLREVADALSPYAVAEADRAFGHRPDLPGRGQAMAPAVMIDSQTSDEVRGRVTISHFYLGGGGAAHGGVPPLVWDEILGRLANSGGRTRSRTAYLHVDYRSVTPIDEELTFDGRFDRVEGRKRFLSGRMYRGEVLVSEASGLFVELRLGQP